MVLEYWYKISESYILVFMFNGVFYDEVEIFDVLDEMVQVGIIVQCSC